MDYLGNYFPLVEMQHDELYAGMLQPYSDDAELEAAQCADRMLGRGDREELLNWFRATAMSARGGPAANAREDRG